MFSTTVFASPLVYEYSEWSPLYPDGLDERFIESEVRYRWYKFENGMVDYTEDYYTELEGYTRDDKSAKTFLSYKCSPTFAIIAALSVQHHIGGITTLTGKSCIFSII